MLPEALVKWFTEQWTALNPQSRTAAVVSAAIAATLTLSYLWLVPA